MSQTVGIDKRRLHSQGSIKREDKRLADMFLFSFFCFSLFIHAAIIFFFFFGGGGTQSQHSHLLRLALRWEKII